MAVQVYPRVLIAARRIVSPGLNWNILWCKQGWLTLNNCFISSWRTLCRPRIVAKYGRLRRCFNTRRPLLFFNEPQLLFPLAGISSINHTQKLLLFHCTSNKDWNMSQYTANNRTESSDNGDALGVWNSDTTTD